MKHNVYGKHLGRDKNQRQALFRGLIRSLFLEESITTTEAKYKAIKGLIDRLISKARDGSNASKNIIFSQIPQKEVSKKLLEDIAPRYKKRTSGFVSTVRIGTRKGDGAMMMKISLMPGDKQIKSDEIKKPENQKISKPEKAGKSRKEKLVAKP